ncbi:MAG: hypothetical protein ACPG19_08730 [Saprospiraceae bacterium]
MKKRILYSFIAVLIGILSMPAKISNGCGFYDSSFYVYSFVKPSLIKSPAHRPFFFTFVSYFSEWKGKEFALKENLKEWQNYFGVDETFQKDITYLIYKSSIGELKAFQNGGISTKSIKQNIIAQKAKKNNNAEFFNYILFAKACEPFAVNRKFGWNGKLINAIESKQKAVELIKRGSEELSNIEDDFLKARYTFQVVRLARYSMDWQKTIDLYKSLMPKVKDVETIINYWTREHYAGALYNMNKKTEAAYHFAQIFDQSLSRRMAAFNSFEIRSDEDWKTALGFCKNNQEKAALYSIRAIDPISNATEEMKTIFELFPKSEHLEFLLFREIQKFEYEFLGANYSGRHNYSERKGYFEKSDKNTVSSKESLRELINLTKEIIASKQIKNPHFWELAQGYLTFMNGENEAAMSIFNKISSRRIRYDDTFVAQLKVFKAAVLVDNLDKIDASVEEKVVDLLPLLKNVRPDYWGEMGVSEQANYLLDKLSTLYTKQGDYTKAFLCGKGKFYNLLEQPNLKVVEGLLKLYDRKESLNTFERELTKTIFKVEKWTSNGYEYKEDKVDIRNQLLEMKGTILLGKNQLEAAIATFEKLPDDYKNSQITIENNNWNEPVNSKGRFNISDNNPFYLFTYNTSSPERTPANFNKLELAKQLLAIEESLEKEPATQAASYLKLGNAYYQMSYHGKSWRAIDYTWSVAGGHFMTNDNALEYLKKAIEIGKTEDRESAAKACFVASACILEDKGNTKDVYFGKLKDEFSDTEFYAQAIQECTWFYTYVNK